jgi:hypothetical protein
MSDAASASLACDRESRSAINRPAAVGGTLNDNGMFSDRLTCGRDYRPARGRNWLAHLRALSTVQALSDRRPARCINQHQASLTPPPRINPSEMGFSERFPATLVDVDGLHLPLETSHPPRAPVDRTPPRARR